MTLIEFTDRLSPFLCRLLARRNVSGKTIRRLTVADIAMSSGLSARTVIRLSKLHSWNGVDVGTASRFMGACKIDPFNAGLHLRYLRYAMKNPDSAFRYLRSKKVKNYLAGLVPE